MTTALINDTTAVEFTATHRESGGTGPVAITITTPLELSRTDIEAVLWILVRVGVAYDDLIDDDDYVRRLVVETLLDEGTGAIQDAAYEMHQVKPRTKQAAARRFCQRRAAELFPTPHPTRTPARRAAAPRALATVGGA